MTTQIILPKLGFSVDEASISEWLISDGGTIEKGQILFSVESEKSVTEIESPASGTLKIIHAVGEILPVGTVIGEIV